AHRSVQHREDDVDVAGEHGRQCAARLDAWIDLLRDRRVRTIGKGEKRGGGGELGNRVTPGQPVPLAGDTDRHDLVLAGVERLHDRQRGTKRDVMLVRLATEQDGDADLSVRMDHDVSPTPNPSPHAEGGKTDPTVRRSPRFPVRDEYRIAL